MAADLAIEITKVAVEALVNKVRSAMNEEAEQWQTVQRDLVFIVDEFEMMQSFLGSADREAVKTHVVRTWVRQVRDLSHDLEDCIEFISHLDTDKRRWWLRLRPSCSCISKEEAALPVEEAVAKIKQLKARVEEVSQRNIRYRFIFSDDSAAGSKFPTPPPPQEVEPAGGTATGTRGFDILVEARDTAARYRSVGDLTKLVMGESNDIQVISVWGTGDDFGTTSIIRSMYDEPQVHERFRSRAWVKVMHPINIPELIRSLVVQFYANSWQQDQDEATAATAGSIAALSWLYRRLKKGRDALSWTETSAGDLVKELVRKINSTQPYLIVLEDLSAMDQWDAIRPYLLRVRGEKKNGSRIVVSTRHHEIASLCTGKPYRVSELQRLSASQSICVFFNTGSREVEEKSMNSGLVGRDAEIEKVFNLIIKRRPDNSKPHVVCVWGLPGSGRTAVVTNVYNKMAERFEYTRMLDMSQPYNLMGFCRCLLSDVDRPVSLQGKNPIERCREFLRDTRCLVVIDEVKSREEWKLIEDAHLISEESKSCIVIVTTEESVAVHCAGAEDLVCSIKCLQQRAAFKLFQQAFQDQYQIIRNTPKKQEIQNRGNGNLLEQTLEFIFETGTLEELAFQNNGNSFEGEAVQNNGNSFEGEAFQNNGNLIDGEASQNTGNLMEGQTFQNNGKLIDGEASENNGNLMEEQTFQNNGNLIDGEASQNSGNILEEQTYQKNGKLIDGEAFQNNGNLLKKQTFRNNMKSLEDHAIQYNGKSFEEQVLHNNGNSFEEKAFQNDGNSFPELAFQNNSVHLLKEESFQNNGNLFEGKFFQEAYELLFEANRQDEYGFQNNGSSYEEHACENNIHSFDECAIRKSEICDERAFENSGKSFEEVASENCESSFEEQSDEHCGNLIEELKTLENGMPLEEHKMEDSLEEQTYLNNPDSFQNDPNVQTILSKSGGFPQVIVALGRYLARQHVPNNNIGATEWQCQRLITNFMQELQTNPQFYCLRGLLAWMRSHFSSCPPSLMRCMLYLQIFPQAQALGRKRLVRRWIAEGYAKNTESHSSSDEEYAGELFNKLASQGVIVNVMQQQEARYEVNGFFHEYMISRPMEGKILSPLEVSVLHDGHGRVTPQGVGQHLSVWSNWERKNRVGFDSLDLSRLRSFTVFGRWERFFLSDKMAVLRVLDLEDSTDVKDEDVDLIAKVLLRLKFLSLRGCKDISRLPDSLGGLSQLQTLDIRGTSVDKIGPCITKLQKLQYVRAWRQPDEDTSTVQPAAETSSAIAAPAPAPAPPSSTSRPTGTTLLMSRLRLPQWMTRRWRRPLLPGSRNGGVRMHGGIGKMTALHTLGVIDVSVASGRSILVELGKLSQLRKLGVSGVNRENVHGFCSSIACHSTHLESLSVWFDKGMNRDGGCLDAISSDPMKLQSLKLYGHQDNKLPSWMNLQPERSLLCKLDLHMTTIPQVEIDQVLADLPKLRTLFLCFEEFQDDGLQFRGGFKALQLMEIALNRKLKAVTFHSGAMNNIEVLRLRCRDDVQVAPSFFFEPNSLDNLDEVKLTGSRYCHDAMKQLLKIQLHVHPRITRPVVTSD